jgi:Heterokaryon incompatibility protein (HET)
VALIAHTVFKLSKPFSRLLLTCAIGLAQNPTHLAENTGSDDCIRQCKSWLSSCSSMHDVCSFTGSDKRWIPSRLLEICPDSGRVKLRMRNEVHSQHAYVTLSHCWGNIPMLKLTHSTLNSLRKNIPLKNLPKTFLDAIMFTRRMGLRYLWIDSLCIVQDSVDDWTKEASLMADVYKNARFNIAATAAINSHHGMFYDRDPLKIGSCLVLITWDGTWFISEQDVKGSYYLTRKDAFDEDICLAPLNKRGWVLQERLLSRRIFHFSKNQIYWECTESLASESFPYGQEPGWMFGFQKEHCFHLTLPEARKLRQKSYRADGLYSTWRELLEQFTMCELTFPKDKFIAIDGIASTLQSWLEDVYIAGCWKGSILYDLLWKVSHSTRSVRLPLKPRAPSWSWASIDAEVDFHLSYCDEDEEVTFHTKVIETPEAQHEAAPGSIDHIFKSAIRLRGPLKKATEFQKSWTSAASHESNIQNQIVKLDLYADIPKVPLESKGLLGHFTASGIGSISVSLNCLPTELFLLPIVTSMDNGYSFEFTVRGLALLPTQLKRGEFFRYGAFEATATEMKDILTDSGNIESALYESMTDDFQYVISIV